MLCFCLFQLSTFKGGKFHRNAGHVLQASVKGSGKGLAYQEYSPEYPHKQFTLGYAGKYAIHIYIFVSEYCLFVFIS